MRLMLSHHGAKHLLRNHHEYNNVPERQRVGDTIDMLCFFTIRLGEGTTIQKAGKDRYLLSSPEHVDIPPSWVVGRLDL
jgi:hypothetical protein